MPEVEVVDEVVGSGPSKQPNGNNRRGVIEDIVENGTSRPSKGKSAGVEDDEVSDSTSGRRERTMKESTKKLLAKLDSTEEDDDEDGEEEDDPDAKALDAKDKAAPKPAPRKEAVRDDDDEEKEEDDPDEKVVDKKDAKKTEETKDETDEFKKSLETLKSDYERVTNANRKLTADLEAATAKPKAAPMSERLKMLDEAEKLYLDDSIGAIRRVIGTVLGKKFDSKEVDEEMAGLYTDLTAKELNVPLEQAHRAVREAARTRQLVERDKRERQSEAETTTTNAEQDADVQQLTLVTEHIGKLNAKQADGTALLDKYPLLMAFSERLDGMKPEVLLWRALQRETKAGTIKPGSDSEMLEQAAALIEAHYNDLGEQFTKVKTKKTNDTTKQETKKADETGSKDQRSGTGTRTIKAADASVAPASPPAKKKTEVETERPKFKSKKEAQDWALRHITD